MPDITITFSDKEPMAVRCYKRNAHMILKIGSISLVFAAGLLPVIQTEITKCLEKAGSK